MPRKRRKLDASRNRKLNEFLTDLQISKPKKEQIIEFVEKLTFERLKDASTKKQKPALRLKR